VAGRKKTNGQEGIGTEPVTKLIGSVRVPKTEGEQGEAKEIGTISLPTRIGTEPVQKLHFRIGTEQVQKRIGTEDVYKFMTIDIFAEARPKARKRSVKAAPPRTKRPK
jgi:hypothetical protein